jgi:hypothetical protein
MHIVDLRRTKATRARTISLILVLTILYFTHFVPFTVGVLYLVVSTVHNRLDWRPALIATAVIAPLIIWYSIAVLAGWSGETSLDLTPTFLPILKAHFLLQATSLVPTFYPFLQGDILATIMASLVNGIALVALITLVIIWARQAITRPKSVFAWAPPLFFLIFAFGPLAFGGLLEPGQRLIPFAIVFGIVGVSKWTRPTRTHNRVAFAIVLVLACSQAIWVLSYGIQTASEISVATAELKQASSDGLLIVVNDHFFIDPRDETKKLGDIYNTRLKTLTYTLDRLHFLERIDSQESTGALETGYLRYTAPIREIQNVADLRWLGPSYDNIVVVGSAGTVELITSHLPSEYSYECCTAEVRLFRK